jgi:hypothetical protein
MAIKQELMEVIRQQPDASSAEDIVREVVFHVMVRGLADSDAGRPVSNEQMGQRIRSSGK